MLRPLFLAVLLALCAPLGHARPAIPCAFRVTQVGTSGWGYFHTWEAGPDLNVKFALQLASFTDCRSGQRLVVAGTFMVEPLSR
ncbi:MAG: hypothetical protein KGL39_49690 [Patescibacteria group bacterium]|nr:hypothetical protein [Patescibacteria group bacterium]